VSALIKIYFIYPNRLFRVNRLYIQYVCFELQDVLKNILCITSQMDILPNLCDL